MGVPHSGLSSSKVPRPGSPGSLNIVHESSALGLIRINVNYCFFSKMSFGCETGNLSILSLSKSTCIHQWSREHPTDQFTWRISLFCHNKNGSQNIAKVDDIPPSISVHKPLQSEFMSKFISGTWLHDELFSDMPNAM